MTILILQARLDSSRLPGKSMLDLCGAPLLVRVMEALQHVRCDRRILACPESCVETFSPYAASCAFGLVGGPSDDVLARYCIAARSCFKNDEESGNAFILRATADNPFVMADAACALAEKAGEENADYGCFSGIPYGSGVEFIRAAALFRAEKEAREKPEREHVCPYLYNHGEKFRLYRPLAPERWRAEKLALSVDTAEDLRRARILYRALDSDREAASEPGARYRGETIIRVAGGCL